MQRYTIKEIAEMAGVSPSAVSIVINKRKGVSEDTRKKIEEIINNMNYIPNPNSRRLLLNKTNNIAILLRKDTTLLDFFFYADLNRFVLHECEANGYNVIFSSYFIENNEVNLPGIVKCYDVDGVIFYDDVEQSVVTSIKKYDIPFVIIDDHSNNPEITGINFDYCQAAYCMTNYLISQGHTKIAYIGNSASTNFGMQTFIGFKNAAEANKISISFSWVQFCSNNDESSIRECIAKIFSFGSTPTALFCSTDMYAVHAIRLLKEKGLRVPDDISVAGIDDITLSSYIEPPLTTVKVDRAEMGIFAVNTLVKKINGEEIQKPNISPCNLIIRSSTKSISI